MKSHNIASDYILLTQNLMQHPCVYESLSTLILTPFRQAFVSPYDKSGRGTKEKDERILMRAKHPFNTD